MTQRPASNFNPDAEPYRRWLESQLKDLSIKFDNVSNELSRLANSDGGQAELYANLKTTDIATLFSQLKALYTATGVTYPPVPPAPAPPPVVPTYTTIETGALDSGSWGSVGRYAGSGHYDNAHMLYQGSGENKIGLWTISMGAAAGKNITDMQMFLQNTDWPYSSGGVASFGVHSNATVPVGRPSRNNGFDIGWGEGEGKWVGVPGVFWPGFSNGSFKGFTVGGIGPNNPQSAIFAGVGGGAAPRLRITYQN